jgi:hypothetical protein
MENTSRRCSVTEDIKAKGNIACGLTEIEQQLVDLYAMERRLVGALPIFEAGRKSAYENALSALTGFSITVIRLRLSQQAA